MVVTIIRPAFKDIPLFTDLWRNLFIAVTFRESDDLCYPPQTLNGYGSNPVRRFPLTLD
jgi:hypothetical protein